MDGIIWTLTECHRPRHQVIFLLLLEEVKLACPVNLTGIFYSSHFPCSGFNVGANGRLRTVYSVSLANILVQISKIEHSVDLQSQISDFGISRDRPSKLIKTICNFCCRCLKVLCHFRDSTRRFIASRLQLYRCHRQLLLLPEHQNLFLKRG